MTRTTAPYVTDTPPYCDVVECYVHGDGTGHHVEGCFAYDTFEAARDRLRHELDAIRRDLEVGIAEIWPGLPWRVRVVWRLVMSRPWWIPRMIGDRLVGLLMPSHRSTWPPVQ